MKYQERIDVTTIEPLPHDSLAILAGDRAVAEAKEGRTVVILFPPASFWGCVAFDMGPPPEGVYLRFDDHTAELKSLRVDTLIVIRPKECENLPLAVQMLDISISPKVVEII